MCCGGFKEESLFSCEEFREFLCCRWFCGFLWMVRIWIENEMGEGILGKGNSI